MNLRVKGGAYGAMMRFDPDGRMVFCSYRDPHLRESLDVYKGIPDYLRNFEVSERDLRKYIIGTFGAADAPMLPAQIKFSDTNMHFLKKIFHFSYYRISRTCFE